MDDDFYEDGHLVGLADDVYGVYQADFEDERRGESDYEDANTDDDVQILGSRVQGTVDPPTHSGRLENDSVEVGKSPATGKGKMNNVDKESGTQCSPGDKLDMYGLICSICMEPWTSGGQHHISCLPCGHIFGLSCITKWIKLQGRASKCPQCNKKCGRKDVRKLFASAIATVDEESQKRIRILESKCDSLEKQGNEWCKKESEWKKKEATLQSQLQEFSERNRFLEHLLADMQRAQNEIRYDVRSQDPRADYLGYHLSDFDFRIQAELQVNHARLLDINASGHLLLAQRLLKSDASHVLTKINLTSSHRREIIYLPSNTKFVKDIHISPTNENLALCATLGKQLLVVSADSNSVTLSYKLPAPAWSCSWDRNNSFYTYTGLQNGFVLVFDLRQTSGPVESHSGINTNPVHTIHSIKNDPTLPSGVRSVLSASSSAFCHWNFDDSSKKPSLVHETPAQQVCISLACSRTTTEIVATYRPRADYSDDMASSQPVSTGLSRGIQGFHRHIRLLEGSYKQLGDTCCCVSDVRLPPSVIIERRNQNSVFASGDEMTRGLLLRELPSFDKFQLLKPHQHYICDVKYGYGFLCSLSENRLQIYRS